MTRPEGLLAALLALAAAPAVAIAQGERLPVTLSDTMGSFLFVDSRGDANRPITVWYYRPSGLRPGAHIVFVMHGSSRTAQEARDIGAVYGRRHGLIVLAPEFSERYYPGDAYAFGNMADSGGRLRPESQWALSAIEHLFDAVRQAVGLTTRALCPPVAEGGIPIWGRWDRGRLNGAGSRAFSRLRAHPG